MPRRLAPLLLLAAPLAGACMSTGPGARGTEAAGVEAAGVEAAAPAHSLALGFDSPAELKRFELSDAAAWRIEAGSLSLFGESDYEPPHRSPRSLALLRGPDLGDFVLEAALMQTGPEYGHRDLCLVFGHQDPAHFYYVHLATKPDPNAHNVFLVDGADRRPLAPVPEVGVDWGTGAWHHVRLERSGARIEVRFDGCLLLAVEDATLGAGRIGLGSFDDQGRFDDLHLTSPDPVDAFSDSCDL